MLYKYYNLNNKLKFYCRLPQIRKEIFNKAAAIIKKDNRKTFRNKKIALRQPNKIQTKKRDCTYYILHGKCRAGDSCIYAHDLAKLSICRNYLSNNCNDSDCPLSHEIVEVCMDS
jgi:hypothetical protein